MMSGGTSFRKVSFCRFVCAVFVFILWALAFISWVRFVNGYVKYMGVLLIIFDFPFLFLDIQKKYNVKVKVNFLKKRYVLLLAILLLIFAFPFYAEPIMEWQSEKNKIELQKIVNELTQNATNDVEKTRTILSWFNNSEGNIQNVYGKKWLFGIGPLYIFWEKPYFCIRIIQHKYPLWVLTSRCGACGEYSLLFREMVNAANLTVRSVHNPGEDHNWDEVLIDGKWIVVDPTEYLPFNISSLDVEEYRKTNISYVFAEYPNGTKEDISYRYTNLSKITFKVVDDEGGFVSNVTVKVLSNNLKNEQMDTTLNCVTNDIGRCTLAIGGGNYEFVAKTNGIIPLYNKTYKTIYENKEYSIILTLKKNIWELSYPQWLDQFFYFISIIFLWLSIVRYLELLKLNKIKFFTVT